MEPELQEAPLRSWKSWKSWHGHHHKRWHRCRKTSAEEGSSCAWSSYSEGLSGAPATLAFFDPRERGVVYAAVGGDIFRSTDSGETWSPRGNTAGNVTRLDVDGPDPSGLIAATGGGIKVSNDAGASWTTIGLSGLQVEALQIPTVQPQRVYSVIDSGPLLLSTDAGEHWNVAGVNYPRGDTFGLSVDPRSALELVAALQFFTPERAAYDGRGAIFRSSDGGVSWQTVYDPGTKLNALVRCPANPDVILAATRAGVARSLDNGATWTLSAIASATEGSVGIAVNPHDCDDYYALQGNEGPRHTRDGGATFSAPLVEGLQLVTAGWFPGSLAIDPDDPTHLILSTHGAFYTSHDSGEHWSVLPVTVFMNVTGLAVSPSRPSEVWLSTWGQGVWRRTGENAAWERFGIDRLPRDYVASLGLDHASRRAVIGANPPLFTADGESFAETGTAGFAAGATFHPSDPDVIYMTTQVLGVFKSEDGGQSWQDANANLPRWATNASTGVDARALVIDPARSDHLYLATSGHGIFRSEDAARSWTQVLASTENATCLVLVQQPLAAPHLYACLSGVTVSRDGGATWSQLNDGLPGLGIFQLLHDPESGRLYASSGRGIFVLDPGEEAWRALDPDCEALVRGMAVMTEGGRRYLVVGAEHSVRRIAL